MAEVEVVRCDRCGRDGATIFGTFVPDPDAKQCIPSWLSAIFAERVPFDVMPDGRQLWQVNFCEACAREIGLPGEAFC
jgi:hypothetical protein